LNTQAFRVVKARTWWKEHSSLPFPESTDAALKLVDTLLVPTHIKVWVNTPFPVIMAATFIGAFEKKIVGEECPF